ncbi:MAG: coproporphyrinogen dehydrogenase HemZ [Clostridiales bacterium]|nr:coproporphyrinogen dehydrogenase HemZ [Clostridiales bacterium]
MKLLITTPQTGFIKELAEVAAIFFGQVILTEAANEAQLKVIHSEDIRGQERYCTVSIEGLYAHQISNSEIVLEEEIANKRMHKRQVKNALYQALKRSVGSQPPWGSLTGIRPTRLVYEAMSQGISLEDALKFIRETFDVIPVKAELLGQVIRSQQKMKPAAANEVDVYIGIPFCESRCRYCSFISSQVGNRSKIVPYTDALVHEIHQMIQLIHSRGFKIRAFYMGGGTPTALDAELLDKVLTAASPILCACYEKTVEAGRPDSITKERLHVLQKHHIGRISINPQTIHDKSLEIIGRRHTHAQTQAAYELANSMGFEHINMDLIAGLPGETVDMFKQTLSWAREIAPQSLTVHSLCVKRSSEMHRWQDSLPEASAVEEMVSLGLESALSMGMEPYYLYRQKHMAGNLENVGYALPDMACLYNVDTMEDTVSILAMGAGGISKRVTPRRDMVYRAPNVKEIDCYIERIDELIERKRKLWS